MNKEHAEFSQPTLEWLEQADLQHRQKRGQFMTPRSLRSHLLEQLNLFENARVLDPGVGTGEFLKQALELNPNIKAFGWDVDEMILSVAQKNAPGATYSNRSALEPYTGEKFDFVIGNPPYFEMKPDPETKARFAEVISGRANIYALFFKLGLEALKPGGTLAFVVPPSMNAGAYFKALRNHIVGNFKLVSIKVFHASDLFQDAQTAVQVVVIKNEVGASNHVLNFKIAGRPNPFFFESPEEISQLFSGMTTLWDLGYEAVTGNIVWNKFKESLVNEDSAESLILYYARNIQNGELRVKPDEKKPQYLSVSDATPHRGPAILVNRIIGGVGKGQVNSALVPGGEYFFAENHLNVIRPRNGVNQLCSIEELFEKIKENTTLAAARLITGNTQLSATEWNHLIPLKANS